MKHMLLFGVCIFACVLLTAQEKTGPSPASKLERPVPDLFLFKTPESTLLKVDLLNTFRRLNGQEVFGLLNIGLEQKINTSFSIDSRIATEYHIALAPHKVQPRAWNGMISLEAGPRYYYNLRRRIRMSRSADNLSANYLSLVATTRLVFPRKDPRVVEPLGNFYFHRISVSPVYGIQRRIGRWMYVDVQTGFRLFSHDVGDPATGFIISTPHFERWKVSPFSTVRFGVAF